MRARTLSSRRVLHTALASSIAALLAGTAWQSASASVASAARNANLEEVRKLIAAGSDVNVPEADGTSALLWAAHQGDVELVNLLLKAGADANARDDCRLAMSPDPEPECSAPQPPDPPTLPNPPPP